MSGDFYLPPFLDYLVIRVYEKGAPLDAHGLLTVHVLFFPHAQRFSQFMIRSLSRTKGIPTFL